MGNSHAIETRETPAKAAWERIRALLEAQRLRVQQEIVKYPSPIPACDAHFNHLLEERGRISEELARLDEMAAAPGDAIKRLDAFLSASRYLDDKMKRDISDSMNRESRVVSGES